MDFNGHDSGILIDGLTETCVLDLKTCTDGFTIAFWIRWKEWDNDYEYIVSSSWFNIKHFTEDTAPVEVWDGSNSWRIFHTRNMTLATEWQFYTMSWSSSEGLKIYINGLMKEQSAAKIPMQILNADLMTKGKLAFGRQAREQGDLDKTPAILIRRLSLWDTMLSTDNVAHLYVQEGKCYFIYN